MEAFAIWNLIKSALSAAEAPSTNEKNDDNTPPKPNNEAAFTQGKDAPNNTSAGENLTSNDTRPNACEEYFLRHEQLKNHRRK